MLEIEKEKVKKNIVVSMIDYLNRFSTDIKRTNTKNSIERITLENELMELEIENFQKEHERDQKRAKRDYFKSIKKISIGLRLIHFLACVSSLMLTPIGFGLIDQIISGYSEIFEKNNGDNKVLIEFILSITITVILTIIQLKGFYYASIYSQIDQYFHRHAGLAKLITLIIVPISIAGNFNQLIKVMVFKGILATINSPIVLLICMALDFSIILGFKLKHDKKYTNYHTKKEVAEQESDNLTLWNMIKTFTIDFLKMKMMSRFYDMRKKIDKEYKIHNPHENSHEKIQNIFTKSHEIFHDKPHEISDGISNKKIINFHDKSHEINEKNIDKNSLDLDIKSHEKIVDLSKENDKKSHEKISRENQHESYDISAVNLHENFNDFKQNQHDNSHEYDGTISHENSGSNSHEKSHENSDESRTNSQDNFQDKSHEIDNKNSSEKVSKSQDKTHEKKLKKNTNKKNTLEKIEDYINKNYKSGDKINVKDLRKDLKLGEYDWRANRKKLMKSNKLKVDGSDTYVA